jgi:hypothetical protein
VLLFVAGGGGIHRPLNKQDKPARKPQFGSEYKSKVSCHLSLRKIGIILLVPVLFKVNF